MAQKVETCSVAESAKGFAYWSAHETLSPVTKAGLNGAAVVVAPKEGFRDYKGPVFPDGTIELFRFLRGRLPGDLKAAIASEESTFREIALHYDIVRLATLVVEYIAAPVVIGLVVEYLKDRLQSRFSRADVEASIVVDMDQGADRRTWEIAFKGPVPSFQETVLGAVAHLAQGRDLIESVEIKEEQERQK